MGRTWFCPKCDSRLNNKAVGSLDGDVWYRYVACPSCGWDVRTAKEGEAPVSHDKEARSAHQEGAEK